jgi:hypothetical protein
MSSVATISQAKLIFRPTDPSDLERITELLTRAFKSPAHAPYVNPSLMKWKYWEPREDWAGPRSYVLERNKTLVAHAGVWPVTLSSHKGERIRGVHMIDWAAADNSPGAGIALVQKLAGIFDFIYCIGGSALTQRVLPAVGFIQHTSTWRGARPLRPVRQILSHPDRNWKLAPRMVRNFLWSLYPVVSSKNGWRAVATTPQESADLLSSIANGTNFLPRTGAFFDYIFRCPNAALQLKMVHDMNGARGVFALSRVRRQIRLAGLWLLDPDHESWKQAYTLAQKSAAQIVEGCEFVALGTNGQSGEGASSSGLHLWEGPAVYLLDKKRKLSGDFQFQLCDNDAFFSDGARVAYWT